MQYSEDYVAFIDILGFSTFVSNEENGERTRDLFSFIEKFRYFYNTSPNLKTKVSFFSDSIVITSAELESIILAVYIAENYLQQSLGLLFRGGVSYGKYYHGKNITFGPAVVASYKLENTAIYSRIIIDKSLKSQLEYDLLTFCDIDGTICINPYALTLDENIAYGKSDTKYPERDIVSTIVSSFAKRKEELLLQIQKHKGTAVVDKYLWRIRPYNYTCNIIADLPCGDELLSSIGFCVNESLKNKIRELRIVESDLRSI